MSEELKPTRLTTGQYSVIDVGGKRLRAIGSRIFNSSSRETFHQFLVNHLFFILGKPWCEEELAKPLEQRHTILHWWYELCEVSQAALQKQGRREGHVKFEETGYIRALLNLADDVYQLRHALSIPKRIIKRLRDTREFQGARYELFAAGVMARAGYNVEFIDDVTKKQPEFNATKDDEVVAAEAKSRRRARVLHEVDRAERQSADAQVKRLYEDALRQNPGDKPFLVFIDVNLRLSPNIPGMEKPWVTEAMRYVDQRQAEGRTDLDSALILTNYGSHYHREAGAPGGEALWVLPDNPVFPIKEENWALILRALNEYGPVPDEEQRQREVRSRYPEFKGP